MTGAEQVLITRLVPAVSESLDRRPCIRCGRSALRFERRRRELQLRRLRVRPATRAVTPLSQGGALRSQDLRTTVRSDDASTARSSGSTRRAAQRMPDNPRKRRSQRPPDRRRRTAQPVPDDDPTGDERGLDRRRRLEPWEEIDRVAEPLGAVENFGWPCYEGAARQSGYDSANLSICESLYVQGGVIDPHYTYHHNQKVVNGEPCRPANPGFSTSSSIAGLAFYEGGAYPPAYDNALFFADYSRDCIWVDVRRRERSSRRGEPSDVRRRRARIRSTSRSARRRPLLRRSQRRDDQADPLLRRRTNRRPRLPRRRRRAEPLP